jgi:hypothetical protein
MANSFTLTSHSYKGRYMYLECTQAKDIQNNRSTISWKLSSIGGSSNYYTTGPTIVTINGVQVYYSGKTDWDTHKFPAAKGSVSGTTTVPHNNLGDKTIQVVLTTMIYDGVDRTFTGSWTLDSIPRWATITSASNFTDTANPSFSFSNPGGFPMDVWLEPNPIGDHLCVRTSISNTGSYTWTLTDAERNALRNKCAGNSCPIRIGLYTYINGVQYASYVDKTYTITESTATKPSVSVSVSPDNSSLPSAFAGLYVQGKTKLNVRISADGKYGAKITSYSTKPGSKTYTTAEFTTSAVKNAGAMTITSTVKDSRGFTNSASQQITVVAYSAPQITSFTAERQADGTTVVVRLVGGVSPVNNKNTKAFKVTLNGVTKSISASAYTVDGTATFTGVPTDTTLTATAKITDAFSTATKTATVPTVAVTMDFKANGKGVAFGKVSEKDGIETPWNIYMKDSLVTTMANFPNQLGETGYQKLPGGLIVQWGTSVVGTEDTTINFPTAFSEACYVVVGNPKQYGKQSITFWSFTKSSFIMSSGGIRMNVLWIALGK